MYNDKKKEAFFEGQFQIIGTSGTITTIASSHLKLNRTVNYYYK